MSKTMTEEPIYLGHPAKARKIFQLHDAVGRMSVGPDIGTFDLLLRNHANEDPTMPEGTDVMLGKGGGGHHHGGGGGRGFGWGGGYAEAFPVYMDALELYQNQEPEIARIDTEDSYRDYVGDKSAAEIERRVSELEAAFKAHAADPLAHPHEHKDGQMVAQSTIMGAVETISKLRNATTEDQALDSMDNIPIDAPKGVRAWQGGDGVIVCSIKFCAADGTPRVATMADSVVGADVKRRAKGLVKKTAKAALKAQRRADVVFGGGPVVIISGEHAPLAALMHLKQLADKGHPQATREYSTIKAASKSPTGQKVAAPLIAEAEKRLAAGKQKPLLERIAATIKGWLVS